jgi:ribonuclease P protein component
MDFGHAWRHAMVARCSITGAPRGGPSSSRNAAPIRSRRCRVTASGTAFTRTRRLTAGAQFAHVFSGADRSADRYFTVLARLNDVDGARLGLAISRRSTPRAVDRNRLRRLARESFRQLELAPLDYVVMARKDAAGAESPAIRASLDNHFDRLSRRAQTAG